MLFQSKTREVLTQEFIKSLKEDIIPWQKSWKLNSAFNPITNHVYTGSLNNMILSYFSHIRGYKDPRWMTLKQANSKGLKITKGSHGVPIEYWSAYNSNTKKSITILEANKLLRDDPNAKDYIRFIAKSYIVFNAEQIEGIPAYVKENSEEVAENDILKKIETIAGGMGVSYMNGDYNPCYVPAKDVILLPNIDSFNSQKDYASTFLHELAHATGHESRLNRLQHDHFGSKGYALEELRAEISSAFMMGDLSIEYGEDHIKNHKAYVQNWIEVLENDPKQLFMAIKDADKIYDFMMELCPDKIIEKQEISTDRRLEDRIQSAKDKTTDTIMPTKERNDQEVCV